MEVTHEITSNYVLHAGSRRNRLPATTHSLFPFAKIHHSSNFRQAAARISRVFFSSVRQFLSSQCCLAWVYAALLAYWGKLLPFSTFVDLISQFSSTFVCVATFHFRWYFCWQLFFFNLSLNKSDESDFGHMTLFSFFHMYRSISVRGFVCPSICLLVR